jgi:hypothetical protein
MSLKFTCPECSNQIIVERLGPGQKAICYYCGMDVEVPQDAEPSDDKRPRIHEILGADAKHTADGRKSEVDDQRADEGIGVNQTHEQRLLPPTSRPVMISKHYPALRIISVILKSFAVVVAIVGGLVLVFFAVVVLSSDAGTTFQRIAGTIGVLIGWALTVVMLFGSGELLKLFIDLEEHAFFIKNRLNDQLEPPHRG